MKGIDFLFSLFDLSSFGIGFVCGVVFIIVFNKVNKTIFFLNCTKHLEAKEYLFGAWSKELKEINTPYKKVFKKDKLKFISCPHLNGKICELDNGICNKLPTK